MLIWNILLRLGLIKLWWYSEDLEAGGSGKNETSQQEQTTLKRRMAEWWNGRTAENHPKS